MKNGLFADRIHGRYDEMGSVTSTNPALNALMQTLSTLNSPVLSSPTVVAALEKAPPGDIVQLSAAATELQGVDTLFGLRLETAGPTMPIQAEVLNSLA